MSDQSLRRADELLTDLVEHVETARALPMSSSCVLPRERLLDLLDELREVLPPELAEARRLIAARDTLLHDAYTEAGGARERAEAEAASLAEAAQQQAAELLRDARSRAAGVVEQAHAQHDALVAATAVHEAATRGGRRAALAGRDLRAQARRRRA